MGDPPADNFYRANYYTTLYRKGQQKPEKPFPRKGEGTWSKFIKGADRHGIGVGSIAVVEGLPHWNGPEQNVLTLWHREENRMKEVLTNRLARLLCVKSLVTLMLTAVFAAMALRGEVGQDFMTVYTVIIAFYFGTQLERTAQKEGGGS